MASISQMIDDVELRIYAGKPSDDAEIEREQILFWINNINKSLLVDYIKANNNDIPSNILKRFDCIELKTNQSLCVGGCTSNKYIELPSNESGKPVEILSLPFDDGIADVLFGSNKITKLQNQSQVRLNKNIRFASDVPYYHRVGNRLFLIGGIYPSYCKFSIVVATADTTGVDYSENFPTVDKLIPQILDEAERIGLRELSSKYDTQNDGADN